MITSDSQYEVDAAKAGHFFEHVGAPNDSGQAVSEGDDDQAGQHLVGAEDDHGDTEDERDEGTGQHGDGNSRPGKAGMKTHDCRRHRADQHDAFATQVEHPGAFGKHLAHGRNQQRRADPNQRGEKAGLQHLIQDLADLEALPLSC